MYIYYIYIHIHENTVAQLTIILSQLCSLFVSILHFYTTRTLELCSVSVLQQNKHLHLVHLILLHPHFTMKLSTVLAGTFAAFVTAAPAAAPVAEAEVDAPVALPVFERGVFDAKRVNNLNFRQQDLSYLFALNQGSFNFGLLQQLALQNNFNIFAFQDLFNVGTFNINALLQLQQLQTVLAIAQTGVFNQFDLAALNLGALNLGLINGIGAFDIASIIDVGLVPQIQSVVSTRKSPFLGIQAPCAFIQKS